MTEPAAQGKDERLLAQMGYRQELARRLSTFSNFAISFSIICILAGGITAFPLGLCAAGGGGIGVGWLVGSLFALTVTLGMAQIASAFPTAGGLYHWSSILGGRGWGWATAWFNLLGLIFVVSSVNVGVYQLVRDLLLVNVLRLDVSGFGMWHQFLIVALITISQGVFNHRGIRVATKLTDFSGYLILIVAVTLTGALLAFAPSLDPGRLITFVNFTGKPGGDVFPPMESLAMAFVSGLILVVYTIAGFDASAHVSEETHDAELAAPRGMINAVLCSVIFGYLMVAAFVLALPDVAAGARQGWNAFGWLMAESGMPEALKGFLYLGIVVVNYICALAGMTSCSRMIYAFARDGGLPFSTILCRVDAKHTTPVPAIWTAALLSYFSTLYAPAFAVLSAGCAVFLYISYIMPIGAGFFAENRSWTHHGKFHLGRYSKPVALLAVCGGAVLIYVGIKPPFEKVGYLAIALAMMLLAVWFGGERRRFKGPPEARFD